MARIKTALELALEKAASIEVDHEKIKQMDLEKQSGQIANKLMEQADYDFEEALSKLEKGDRAFLNSKVEDVLLSNLRLSSYYNEVQVDKVLNGMKKIKSKPGKVENITTDLKYVLKAYSDQLKEVYENLKEQFAGHMEQMKKQMGQQLGVDVDLDPSQHPEFKKYWDTTKQQVDEQIGTHLDQLKKAYKSLKNLYR